MCMIINKINILNSTIFGWILLLFLYLILHLFIYILFYYNFLHILDLNMDLYIELYLWVSCFRSFFSYKCFLSTIYIVMYVALNLQTHLMVCSHVSTQLINIFLILKHGTFFLNIHNIHLQLYTYLILKTS